jgi:hypothetical protein
MPSATNITFEKPDISKFKNVNILYDPKLFCKPL